MSKLEVRERFLLSASGLMLALILSGGLAHAQSDIHILGQPGLPNLGQQDLPNMGQQITPPSRLRRWRPTVPGSCR